jgi:hypothetical protein
LILPVEEAGRAPAAQDQHEKYRDQVFHRSPPTPR